MGACRGLDRSRGRRRELHIQPWKGKENAGNGNGRGEIVEFIRFLERVKRGIEFRGKMEGIEIPLGAIEN